MSKPEDDVIILGFKCPLCAAILDQTNGIVSSLDTIAKAQ